MSSSVDVLPVNMLLMQVSRDSKGFQYACCHATEARNLKTMSAGCNNTIDTLWFNMNSTFLQVVEWQSAI